jgi:hypothetical protein
MTPLENFTLLQRLKRQANYRRKKMREALAKVPPNVEAYNDHQKWWSAHCKEIGHLRSPIHQALEKHKVDFPHIPNPYKYVDLCMACKQPKCNHSANMREYGQETTPRGLTAI